VDTLALGIGLFSLVVFLFSTVCHEAAHAIAGKLLGDSTAYHNGQVTLNPVPHIQQEPFGLGFLPVFSMLMNLSSGGAGVIGFASAPFDPFWAVRNPNRAAWMAMAGPAANLALAAIAVILIKVGLAAGLFKLGATMSFWRLVEAPDAMEGVAVFLSILYFENILLGIWNLLPIPPMDGFSMLLFVIPEGKVAGFFELRQQAGMIFPLVMLAASGVFSSFFWPLFTSLTLLLFD
jgi:Zn-dependent protease